jgi:DNA replication protein DnaC
MSRKTNQKNPDDVLREQLAYLKLPFIQDHFQDLAQQAGEKQWSHLDFLCRLLEGETAQRKQRATQRRVQQARFPVTKTLEQFDFTWPTKINRPQVQNLFRLKFIEDRANAILVGGVGLGKSHLSIALGYAACLAGYRVLFTTAVDTINNLCAAHQGGRFIPEMKKYLKPDVLVMDELGYLPIDKQGADLLFQIISKRYEHGALVLTTNKAFKQWPSIFNNDSTLTSAILDRLLHHAETIIIQGKSYRMKDRIDP